MLPLFGLLLSLFSCDSAPITEIHEDHQAPPIDHIKNYQIEVESAVVDWKGYDVTDPDGHYHAGTVNLISGQVDTEDDQITGGSFEIDLSSMAYKRGAGKNGAITAEDTAIYGGLMEEIASEEILFLDNFPTATFKIDSCISGVVSGTLSVLGADIHTTITGNLEFYDTHMSFTTDWFPVDLGQVVPFFGPVPYLDDTGEVMVDEATGEIKSTTDVGERVIIKLSLTGSAE